MNITTLASVACTTLALSVAPGPPILPHAHITDEKFQVLSKHMREANNITEQDCAVVLQLNHMNWKYERMREAFHAAAKGAKDGDSIAAKHLGVMFDKVDTVLNDEWERRFRDAIKQVEDSADLRTKTLVEHGV